MKRRITVLLEINARKYKFLSIFCNSNDPSYYFYQPLIDETAPLLIAEPFHLLKTIGRVFTDSLSKKISKDGQYTHLSIHPKRIYLKKRMHDGKTEHLIEEIEPQPFNALGYRLHCVFTPALPKHLRVYNLNKKNEETIVFPWSSQICPQISIYEFLNNPTTEKVDSYFKDAVKNEVISSDGIHPTIVLQIRPTNSAPGIWQCNCGVFGKILKKQPTDKAELQRIVSYNGLPFDLSSLPDDAVISDYKVKNT